MVLTAPLTGGHFSHCRHSISCLLLQRLLLSLPSPWRTLLRSSSQYRPLPWSPRLFLRCSRWFQNWLLCRHQLCRLICRLSRLRPAAGRGPLPRRQSPASRCRGWREPSSAPYHPLHSPLSDRAGDDARQSNGQQSPVCYLMNSNLSGKR